MIYVCIPTHNEAPTVGLLMWKTRKVLGTFGRDYRFLVFDDASTDGTAEVLERYRRKLPLTILRSKERLGYGRAVERLLREAVAQAPYPKRDCAVVVQADFTDDPDDLVPMVKTLEGGADIVAGATKPEPRAPRAVRWARRLARTVTGRAWTAAGVDDPLTGLRAYRIIVLKKALRALEAGESLVHSEGWAANVEVLARVAPHARRIEEVEVGPRYALRTRPSRFRPLPTLLSLFRLRRVLPPGIEARGVS